MAEETTTKKKAPSAAELKAVALATENTELKAENQSFKQRIAELEVELQTVKQTIDPLKDQIASLEQNGQILNSTINQRMQENAEIHKIAENFKAQYEKSEQKLARMFTLYSELVNKYVEG